PDRYSFIILNFHSALCGDLPIKNPPKVVLDISMVYFRRIISLLHGLFFCFFENTPTVIYTTALCI
ncbi:hypothetical protein V6C21_09745, partial [[Clostridium] cellulosi]